MEHNTSKKTRLPGEAMQAALRAKGCELTLEESRRFSDLLLDLTVSGALVFYDAQGNELRPEDADLT